MSRDRAIGLAEAQQLLGSIGSCSERTVVIALSGGPDSVALAGLCADVSEVAGAPRFIAATVDHGLRAVSRNEAEAAGAFASAIGLRHEILTWSGPKPKTGIQARARAVRYGLLADFARRQGAQTILTAHTLDDQAETVLMRLVRGSGLRGLGGMARTADLNGVTIVRPLLGVPKARLVATCRARGWPFVDDPSNNNPAFLRARLRRLQPLLSAEGLSPERLLVLANRLRRADHALSGQVQSVLTAARAQARAGLDAEVIAAAPEEVVVRVFAALLADARATEPRLPKPKLERIERLAFDFLTSMQDNAPFSRTLGGLRFRLAGARLLHSPEPARRVAALSEKPAFDRAALGNPASHP